MMGMSDRRLTGYVSGLRLSCGAGFVGGIGAVEAQALEIDGFGQPEIPDDFRGGETGEAFQFAAETASA
jgi:hypothetical protein